MKFFQQLIGISANLDLTIRITRKGEEISVAIIPEDLASDIPALGLTGTPQEVDEGFFDAITQPIAKAAGLKTNAKDFEAAVNKGLDAATAKPTAKAPEAKKPDAKKPAAPPAKKPEGKKTAAAPKLIPDEGQGLICPWLVDQKLTVIAPGRLRSKEGFLYSTEVNEKGEVEVAFGYGHEWVAIKDMEPAKEEAPAEAEEAQAEPEVAMPAPPMPPGF